MGIAAHLETAKLLRRSRDLIHMVVDGPHPIGAGIGLAASGGLGEHKAKRFRTDFEALVFLAEKAAEAGYVVNVEDVA
jgi:hypothetical protein